MTFKSADDSDSDTMEKVTESCQKQNGTFCIWLTDSAKTYGNKTKSLF